jgi:hypothetical protein
MVPPGFAQSDSSSISGEVTDAGGGAVAGAKVTLRNSATGAQRTSRTDAGGRYQMTLLPPGLYQATAEAPGFRTFIDDGVRLQVALPALLNMRLEVGQVTESVQVTGTASLLNTESASQGTVITEEKIVFLPLNGRQFIQLALLVPGSNGGGRAVQQNSVRLGQTGGLSSSGGRTNNNAFLLDGVNNTDPDYNAISYVPIIDTIAEFQVQTSQYGAQYGRASGAQINVVTKPGTNELHATAWEFLRNQKLDSRPFNSVDRELPKNQRNQFGVAGGGPILKNRLFFFGGYEGFRLRQAGVGITTVVAPSALERQGDFSATPNRVFDPNTLSGGIRQPFPNDRIPAARLNAQTRAALNAMPLPNAGGANFVNGSGILVQDSSNYSGRFDYVMSERSAFFARYAISDESNVVPDVVPNRDRQGAVRPQNVAAGHTWVVSPSATNELRVGFNRLRFADGLPEPLLDVSGTRQELPRFLPAGYPAMGGAGAFTGTTGGGNVLVRNNTYQVYDNFAWVKGRHTLKFGGDLMRIEYNRYETPNPLGSFSFTTGYTSRTAANDGTGNALASMLLGLAQQATRTVGSNRIDGRQWAAGFYTQDDIRIAKNLTINLGLRYELAPPMYDKNYALSSIDFSKVPWSTAIFATGKLNFYQPTLFVCGRGGYPRGCAYTDKNNFSPRVGLAWTPIARTVLRAGVGIFYSLTDNNGLFRLAATLPNNIGQTLNANNFVPQWTNFDVFGGATVGSVAVQQAALDINQRTSYSPQWSLSIQREIGRDMVVEASYLGSLGVKLQQNVQPNNAQPGAGAVDPRRPYAGLVYDAGVVFPPYIIVQGNSVPVTQVNLFQLSAQSNYHALMLRFEKRFTKGLSALSSYTFSKAITNAPQYRNAGGANGSENSPPQDSYNLRSERGLAPYDSRQRLVNTLVYELPFGKGKPFASSGLAAALFGDWQLSGILTTQAGFPFTVNLAGDTAGIGGGSGGILIRANAVPGRTYKLDAVRRSTSQWFDTGAFAQPPAFQFGNVGRNTVVGPGLVNLDTTIVRSFRFAERATLQVRGEFFNLANHPNFNVVGRIINNPTFGVVQNQFDPRQIQFAAKLHF